MRATSRILPRARELRRTMTDAERRLWAHLRDRRLGGFRFRRQHPVGGYVLDFFCVKARIAVEVDGGQHADSSGDRCRDAALERAGVKVLRYWNDDVLLRTERVLEDIARECALRQADPPSLPPLAGEGGEAGWG